MRWNFLLLLLDKTLVRETAHISCFPLQNCGSEVLPNANCIPSEEDGKNQNKPNRPAKQNLFPNFEQLLIPFPLWLHCRTKIISQSSSLSTFHTSYHWNHQGRSDGEHCKQYQTSVHTYTYKEKSNTVKQIFISKAKIIKITELWKFPSGLIQSWNCACFLVKGTYEMQAEQSWLCS